jgi:hypothetical protein
VNLGILRNIILGTFFLQAAASAAWADGITLSRTEFTTCSHSNDQCVRLTSPLVVTSASAQLYSFSNAQLQMWRVGHPMGPVETIKNGYVDLDNQHLVSIVHNANGSVTEKTLNLETFKVSRQLIR